ncbi:MAG TPA: hypothetical protein VEL51_12710 [Vicinamibacterales bacterium]|nr:hypothetical protein [Vicinamibacterales bacterium]
MTTITASRSTTRPAPGAYDRAFYSSMAILMALIVMAGFAPTYYLRGYFGAPKTFSGATSLTPLMQLHGALFTGWLILFIVQTSLVAARRVAVHRRLGLGGVALAAVMIVVGLRTAIAGAARGGAPAGIDPLAFLAIPVFDMIMFAGFVTAAVLRRRDKEAHKRLMLLAYVSIITAGVARLPGVLPYGPPVFFGLSFLFVLAGVCYDLLTRGRVHRVYIWGGALLALSVPLRLAISGTTAWHAIAAFLVH